jgi:hypothetical protein
MKTLTALMLALMAVCPELARADVLNLACSEVSVDFMGISPCTTDCPTVTLAIDMTQKTVVVPPSNAGGDGSYGVTITDSTIDWDSEHDHWQLNRYTAMLRESADPKHGEQMVAANFNWKCSPCRDSFRSLVRDYVPKPGLRIGYINWLHAYSPRGQAIKKDLCLKAFMVGGVRIELTTSSVSRKRSPTELTARAAMPA